MERHREKPGPDHQLDVPQLMPHGCDVPAEGSKGEKYVKPESSVLAANYWCIISRQVDCLSAYLRVWWGGLHLAGVCGSGCVEGLHLSSSLCLCWADSGWCPPSFSMTPYGDPGWTPPTSHIPSLVFGSHRGEAGMPRIDCLQPLAIGILLIDCWWEHMCDYMTSHMNSSKDLEGHINDKQLGEEPEDPYNVERKQGKC